MVTRRIPLGPLLVGAASLVVASLAQAQGTSGLRSFDDNGVRATGNLAGASGRARPVLAPVPVQPDPWQRLDRGALLCDTEADLQQHQAAQQARLDGRTLPEPTGCRIVREMLSISVLERHGPARTEVSLPLPPGQKGGQRVGWTDAAIPKDKPLRP